MTVRRPPGRPVEIVLTEEDLAAIIEETTRPPRSSASSRAGPPGGPSSDGSWPEEGAGAEGGPSRPGFPARGIADEPFAPIADSLRNRGIPRPFAVGNAIRRILEATTLDPGKPTEEE